MPRVVRINLKSGVLPRPRQVVPPQMSAFEQSEIAKVPTGFQDPRMAPRGSSANPPARLPKTADQKIAESAKARQTSRLLVSPEAQWKEHIAEVRRSYLKTSLKQYERREEQHMKAREQRRKVAETPATEVKESVASVLTTPTIESSLLSEFVEKRTPEQQQELQLKRQYNRKLTEYNNLVNQQETLLQLYQDTAKYIVTEEQLNAEIAQKFKPEVSVPTMGTAASQTPEWWKYVNNEPARVLAAREQSREAQLVDALEGTNEGMPGLKAVRSHNRDSS